MVKTPSYGGDINKSNMMKIKKNLNCNLKIKLKNGLEKYLDWHLNYNL